MWRRPSPCRWKATTWWWIYDVSRHCEELSCPPKPRLRAKADATKQSSFTCGEAGLLRGARHRAALCAGPLARNEGVGRRPLPTSRWARAPCGSRACGKITRRAKLRLTRRANQSYQFARPTREEGRIAIVTKRGWDAVDAAASARKVTAGRILDP